MNTMLSGSTVQTGGDPRAFAEFGALREEMGKLSHPARPDVHWERVEQLCLTLFRRNGVELQTVAYYTLARAQQAGLSGIGEGLELMEGLVTHQWGNLWPSQTHARVDIFAWINERLHQVLRTCVLSYSDLPQVYRAEHVLERVCSHLQVLELKHLSKLDNLRMTLHGAALRLESTDIQNGAALPPSGELPYNVEASMTSSSSSSSPLLYVAHVEPNDSRARIQVVTGTPQPRWKCWHGFLAGIVLTALVAGSAIGLYSHLTQRTPLKEKLLATVAPLPRALSTEQIDEYRHTSDVAELTSLTGEVLQANSLQLERLNSLSPLWAMQYGDALIHQSQRLWPASEQARLQEKQWWQQRQASAVNTDDLQQYQLTRTQLQALSSQLNALDEKRGRYITVSALKSAVFNLQQPLDRHQPLEELLRQLGEQQQQGQISPALQQQIDNRFNQLLNRYYLFSHPAKTER
ncbi:VasL domain-containing protein [Pectobacterium sp. B1J-3]|uniref:VasL domain-containing protein n=1 Tax=Pectobacterium sp. B1J-3 TaxID=3385371 RepID=UPI00390634CD